MIDKMTDQEKSVLLSQLCGWLKQYENEGNAWGFTPGGGLDDYYSHLCTLLNYKPEHVTPNLYDPANMALAWRVLNWATEELPGKPGIRQKLFAILWTEDGEDLLYGQEPATAQRRWLDKILTLAIEAGLIVDIGDGDYVVKGEVVP